MQQHATKAGADAMLTAYLQNYLDYRIVTCSATLNTTVPPMVSGELAVMFCPETLKVDESNFVEIIQSRTVRGKIYPGTYLVPLDQLRTKKNLSFAGFFKGGARPINTPIGSDPYKSIFGKLVVGVYSDCLIAEVATTPSGTSAPSTSSSTGSTLYLGPVCKFSIHADLRFIFSAPGQVPPEGQVYAVQQPIAFSGLTERTDPPGIGDYNSSLCQGPTPVSLIDLQNSADTQTSGESAIYPEMLVLRGPTSEDDTSATFLSTTVREIAENVVEGVSEFFPPGIKQLVSFGGRTIIGVISRIVNTQDGMLAKTKVMQQSNNISPNSDVSYSEDEVSLTPGTSTFTPGQHPYNGIPLGFGPQLLTNLFGDAAPGTPAYAQYQLIVWCLVRGIYPFFMTSLSTLPLRWSVNSTQEVFLRNIGGTPQLIPTIVTPGSVAGDDYAGLPMIIQEQIVPLGPWNTKYQALSSPSTPMLRISGLETATFKSQALWEVPTIDFIDFVSSISDGNYNADGLLYTCANLDNIDMARQRLSAYFGVEPVTSGSTLSFSVKFSYCLRTVRVSPDDWSIFSVRSPRSSDNGCLTANISFPFGASSELAFYPQVVAVLGESISRAAVADAYGVYPIRPFEHLLDTGYSQLYDISIQGAPLP